MTVRSYAKINLGLYVLGRRDDGFHELATVFHRVDLYDTLQFESTDGAITLTCDRDDIPTDSGNLCVRAAELLLRDRRDRGVHMDLRKRIPSGAGLGGGSSNAAAVLRALPGLLGLHVTDEQLAAMAAELGSDVPFFLHDTSAEARGRGELLSPFEWSCPWWILLVYPGVHVSTAWAYGQLRAGVPSDGPSLRDALERAAGRGAAGDAEALATVLHNDFEDAVMAEHPEIRSVRDAMLTAGAVGALMSGSGSTVFGLFGDEAQARACAAAFPGQYLTSLTAPGFSPVHIPRDA